MTLETERAHRILATHVGSLPRPDALQKLMAEGKTDHAMVRDAVADVVRRQVDAGIDIVDDGEQSKPGFITYIHERLSGMEPRHDNPPQHDSREKRSFPEFYAHGHSGTRPAPMLCTGPIRYIGQRQLATDIANLKAALKGKSVTDVFMPAVSPGQIERYHVNRYYKTADEFMAAIGEAMREEYKAIIDAGFMLQIDDPHLAMHYMLSPDLSIEDVRRWAEHYVESSESHVARSAARAHPAPYLLRHQYGAAHPRHRIQASCRHRAENPRQLLFLRSGESASRA